MNLPPPPTFPSASSEVEFQGIHRIPVDHDITENEHVDIVVETSQTTSSLSAFSQLGAAPRMQPQSKALFQYHLQRVLNMETGCIHVRKIRDVSYKWSPYPGRLSMSPHRTYGPEALTARRKNLFVCLFGLLIKYIGLRCVDTCEVLLSWVRHRQTNRKEGQVGYTHTHTHTHTRVH